MSDLNPIDVHVGKRLRFGRTMQGMSQEAIGNAIGVTFQQIQKYERGINCIRASKLFELAKILKVSVTFFFEGFEEKPEGYNIPGAGDSGSSYDPDYASSRERIELMNAFCRIAEAPVRSRVVDLVRAIAENKTLVGS